MILEQRSIKIGLFVFEETDGQRLEDIMLGYELTNFLVYNLRETSVDRLLPSLSLNAMDICILDIDLGLEQIERLFAMSALENSSHILIYADEHQMDSMRKCMEYGAKGFLKKGVQEAELLFAMASVLEGESFISPVLATHLFKTYQRKWKLLNELTEREILVVNGLVEGSSYKQIAQQNHMSINTVRDYVKKIYRKLHIQSRGELLYKVHIL